MLRPATPLTILLLISFVFLLLSVISTPIVKSIPIATYQGFNFGVLGYCSSSGCSGIRVGYTTDGVLPSSDNSDFSLPSSTRHSLSSLLIVHPVAAFLNLVCLALAAAAHLHSPSHSARYLLGLLILLLPTLLVTLLAFLVDILLFVPHLAWGGWIVLASTILITASGVVTCAMRRTLVSRKARKKRIAENAEMSGENFYNRQAQETKMPSQSFTQEPTIPMVNGGPGADRLPTFATFDSTAAKSDEERQPLRAQALSNEPTLPPGPDAASERFYPPPQSRSNSRPPFDGPRDQFGNPIAPGPPGSAVSRTRSGDERPPYRDHSAPPLGGRSYSSRGRGGYPPRGGYPSRGGYGPRGPPQGYPGRGGFSSEMRGGYGGRGRGGYGPPLAAAGAMGAGAMMAGGRNRPPPGYGPNGEGGMPARFTPPEEQSSGPPLAINTSQPYLDDARRAEAISPSIYTAQPDDAGPYGARAQSPGRDGMSSYGGRVQSPGGYGRQQSPPPPMPALPGGQPIEMANVSTRDFNPRRSQSQDPYVPARAYWRPDDNFSQPRSPGRYGPIPVELPTGGSHVGGYRGPPRRHRVNSGGSDVYYEDVDPRFAADPEPAPPMAQNNAPVQRPQVPALLTPGGQPERYSSGSSGELPPTNSYEDLPGARSPAESEASNFTSVSQRGVNPNWRPGHGGEFSSLGPGRRRDQQRKQDILLAGNPDFEIPGMSRPGPPGMRGPPRSGVGLRGGMMDSMIDGSGPPRIPPASAVGAGADGRYPGPVASPPPMGPGGMREV